MKTIGVLPLARPTFDVEFAGANLKEMLAALDRREADIIGVRNLLMDSEAVRQALDELRERPLDHILILQVTFTDAAMTVEIARRLETPLSIWAIPEPRIGGRLRLNSFCGLNLAGHALGLNGRDFGYLYSTPGADNIDEALDELLAGGRLSEPVPLTDPDGGSGAGADAVRSLQGTRICRIGAPPDGFDTCAYDRKKLHALAGVSVEELELETLFAAATAVGKKAVDATREGVAEKLGGLDRVNQVELNRSLKLKTAIDRIRASGGFDAFAIRCWPEMFTEYGGAACGPISMMGEAKAPCACEADVYGALTSLLLQRIADAPVFLADLVDLDEEDDTGVVWHCGQAPVSMAAPGTGPRATIHTNRQMPLLLEFPLKSGRVTFFRISQARGRTFAVIGGADMLDRPMAFTGTSGVVRFDSGASTVLERIMGAALEHHMALAYGDHREELKSAAAALGAPVLEL